MKSTNYGTSHHAIFSSLNMTGENITLFYALFPTVENENTMKQYISYL
jgi:hypothetical protein